MPSIPMRESGNALIPETVTFMIDHACPQCGALAQIPLQRVTYPQFLPVPGQEISFGEIRAKVESVRDITPRNEAGEATDWPTFEVIASAKP